MVSESDSPSARSLLRTDGFFVFSTDKARNTFTS